MGSVGVDVEGPIEDMDGAWSRVSLIHNPSWIPHKKDEARFEKIHNLILKTTTISSLQLENRRNGEVQEFQST